MQCSTRFTKITGYIYSLAIILKNEIKFIFNIRTFENFR